MQHLCRLIKNQYSCVKKLNILGRGSRLRTRIKDLAMPGERTYFSFADYDVVGLDLDHTLCKYRLHTLYELIHDDLVEFLVKQRSYPKGMFSPFATGRDFVHRGLVLDKERGNFLKLSADYRILRASHGTRQMSRDEIVKTYGEDLIWKAVIDLPSLLAEGHTASRPFAAFKDFFVAPVTWICAEMVDDLDGRGGGPPAKYNFWEDVYDGLVNMYDRGAFGGKTSGYFSALEENPQKYFESCSELVRSWLRNLHEERKTFLLTSSHVDYATFLARHCLGSSWTRYFDVVVTFARKPGFFTATDRPFLKLHGGAEGMAVPENELKPGIVYSQGNWRHLYGLFARIVGKSNPRVVYVGDSLIEDVYAPSRFAGWDSVAIVEELAGEGLEGVDTAHHSTQELVSSFWGSYFADRSIASLGQEDRSAQSLWHNVICQHSKIAIPHIGAIASLPINAKFTCFGKEVDTAGYYPAPPVSLC